MSLGFVPTFSSCVSAFPIPAVGYVGVFASVFRARAGTFVRIDSTFCTFDLFTFGFGFLYFVPWVWFPTSIALAWGFGFFFFFRFPLLLLLSLCFVPSIVVASDHRVSTAFIRRFRSIVWCLIFPLPRRHPSTAFRVPRVCGRHPSLPFPFSVPSFSSLFVSTHLGWVQQIDVRLEHHGDVGLAWSDDVRASALPHLRRRSPSPSNRRERTNLLLPSHPHPQAQAESGREAGVAAQGGRELSDGV